MTSYLIGVDVGTTSTKSVLFTQTGQVVCKATQDYPLHQPTPDAAEQDPDEIFAAVIQTVQTVVTESEVDRQHIRCLGFSTAMHSLIAVDQQGQPLTASITWADNRSAKYATQIQQSCGDRLYQKVGTPIHPMLPLVKLLWLRQEHPEIFQQADKFISIKEYILYRLYNEYVVDHAIAAATGLLNLKTLAWDEEALDIAGIAPDKLSELVPTTHILPNLQGEYRTSMGLPEGIPTVIGASDGVLSNLGLAAMKTGVVAVTIGTSSAVRTRVSQPQFDPQGRLFCYPLTEQDWIIGGASNNGGITLRWLRDNLADTEVATAKLLGQSGYEMLDAIAQTIPCGSQGLLFYPYLTGERSPLWNPNARASFIGLTLHHTKPHLVRAVLEGTIYNLYLIWQILNTVTPTTHSIHATGGFASSPLWRQILADVFNQAVTIPECHESSSLGTMLLALYALKDLDSLEDTSNYMGHSYCDQPIPENATQYQKILPVYAEVLEQLQQGYDRIAQLQTQL
jgi:gluconokinase